MMKQIIVQLMAIQGFAKDIHYKAKGLAAYGEHLLADRIADGLNDFQDTLKEVYYLGNGLDVPASEEFCREAAAHLPIPTDDNKANFETLKNMLIEALATLEQSGEHTRAETSILDAIAQDLQQKLGLVNLEVR